MLTNNSKLIANNHNQKLKTDLKYRSYYFSIDLIKFANTFPAQKTYWLIADQLLRSATSIGANIIEAKASASKKDFINYFQIALKSANETLYWLSLLKDTNLVETNEIKSLVGQCQQLCKMLGSSSLTMKGKR